MHNKGLAEELPPLTPHEAIIESNRCLYCYDAPCTHACPTHIDIPRFIKKISTGNVTGSANAIFESNLLGATCARVCPVQELCEGACVLGKDHKPISIGRLQRYAMDAAYDKGTTPAVRSKSGKKVAVVGAGPAGLSCAGELARQGHSVTIFEKRSLAGGLSTYGIISLREPIEASLREVAMIQRMGVEIVHDKSLGHNLSLDQLRTSFDAVFVSIGLGKTPDLGIPGEALVLDGLEFIESSKLQPNQMQIGSSVAVIGAGNTAIDCATIAKRLGAARVIMVYRRSENEMTAYPHEYEFVRREGVEFRFLAQPIAVESQSGKVTGLVCRPMQLVGNDAGRATSQPSGGPDFTIACDQIVKAIGQEKPHALEAMGIALERGYVKTNQELETTLSGVFAGGDCIRVRGTASTVMAVQDGKLAAAAIHRRLGSN